VSGNLPGQGVMWWTSAMRTDRVSRTVEVCPSL
jgi:hypothetical protein